MKDERIQATANSFAARGFFIWFSLLPISLLYRVLILKQHVRDFWDILAIFFIGAFFVFIAYARKGVLDHDFKRRWLVICISASIGAFIGSLAVQFIFLGRTHAVSVVDVGTFLIAFPLGIGPVIGMSYFLNRRWKRKEGIEDEN